MSTVTAYLRHTMTGETKAYKSDAYDWPEKSNARWMWTGGNFCCDCNRSLFLYDHDESKEMDCSYGENVIALDRLVWDETGEDLL